MINGNSFNIKDATNLVYNRIKQEKAKIQLDVLINKANDKIKTNPKYYYKVNISARNNSKQTIVKILFYNIIGSTNKDATQKLLKSTDSFKISTNFNNIATVLMQDYHLVPDFKKNNGSISNKYSNNTHSELYIKQTSFTDLVN